MRSKVSPCYNRRNWSSEISSDSLVPLGYKRQSHHRPGFRVYPLSWFHTASWNSFPPQRVSDRCQGRAIDRGQHDPVVIHLRLEDKRETWGLDAGSEVTHSWLEKHPEVWGVQSWGWWADADRWMSKRECSIGTVSQARGRDGSRLGRSYQSREKSEPLRNRWVCAP